MSTVTTATILVSWAPPEVEARLTDLAFDSGRQGFAKMPGYGDWVGGSKFMECDLYAAGLNHVSPLDVTAWFRSLEWGEEGSAFLVWERNGEDRGFEPINWFHH